MEAQNNDSKALIIIDIQDFYFPGGKAELVEPEKAVEQAKLMLDYFRMNNELIIHVKHNFGIGGDIYDLVRPLQGEKVFTKNEVNAFADTDLDAHLHENQIKKLVLCGMQTHMCLEAATRAAHDLGYQCIVIQDACATRDVTFDGVTVRAKDVHFSTLATLKNYATIITASDYISKK